MSFISQAFDTRAGASQRRRMEVPYRKAIDVFGRELCEDEKIIVLKGMTDRTRIMSRWAHLVRYEAFDNLKDLGIASAALALPISLAPHVSLKGAFAASVIAVAGLKAAMWSCENDSDGVYYRSRNTIVLRPGFSEDVAFHEAIHYLEGNGVMRDSGEYLAVAATALFSGWRLKNASASYCRQSQPFLYWLNEKDHERGLMLARRVIRMRSESGVEAAWDFLYRRSKEGPFLDFGASGPKTRDAPQLARSE